MDGRFVFVSVAEIETDLAKEAIGTFREVEGLSLLVSVDAARDGGFTDSPEMAMITLSVYSDLEGVGLTAAVSGVLAEAGIAANVIAAYHHDHVFVPAERAQEALALLKALQKRAALAT